jgi:hypothetical protein
LVALATSRDKTFKQLALSWLANAGPFWDDDRAFNADDFFHFGGEDVTDQGLGEAARRLICGEEAATISFLNPPADRFKLTPIEVGHGLPDDSITVVPVSNFWDLTDLEQAASRAPTSWDDMLLNARNRMPLLHLSDQLPAQLQPHPFGRAIAERTLDLLWILQCIAEATQEDGSRTGEGKRLYELHFIGAKPQFTDESDDNKRNFRSELTFRDPDDPAQSLFCPWHGKVKVGQYRIHFEWPRPIKQRHIKILYIGPKITKA